MHENQLLSRLTTCCPLHVILPADVERPPGVAGEGGDLPGDELDGVAVEDPQSGEAGGHDLPEWKFIINRCSTRNGPGVLFSPELVVRVGREGEAREAEARRHAVHHDPLGQVHRVGDRKHHQPGGK